MSAHSSNTSTQSKPVRPEGSTLFWHATGRWTKKIRGRFHYFGRGSHDDALAEYNRQADDLHSGRLPRDAEPHGLTIYRLCAKFLTAKLHLRDNKELSPHTYLAYGSVCKLLQKAFGNNRLVSDLRPDDFAKLRKRMSKTWGLVRLKAEIIRVRTVMKFATSKEFDPANFGEGFKIPSQTAIDRQRAENGPKMFEAEELRSIIEGAKQPLKAMMLLGINCGFGNNDIGLLPFKALDLAAGVVQFPRPKTAVARKCFLWPETVEAMREWLKKRPEPKKKEHAELVFITVEGNPWGSLKDRTLSHEMRKLLDKLKIDGRRNFYALRHGLQTIGDEVVDFVAVRRIMGHKIPGDIAEKYRERISDDRLRRVTDHVHDWLFTYADKKLESGPDVLPFASKAG